MWRLDQLKLPPIEYITREESLAIETNDLLNGVKAYDLMLAAGKAVADYVSKQNPTNILIFCGSGNNGGDGLVAARILSKNHNVTLVLVKPPKTPESMQAFSALQNDSIKIIEIKENTQFETLIEHIEIADLIVDSLIGVGLKSEVTGIYAKIINTYSELKQTKLCCVDIPSGLDCNTGNWLCKPYEPNSVVTMEFSKLGLKVLNDNCEVLVSPIGISEQAGYFVDRGHFISFWPKRELSSHKGENGRIIIIGGSDGFTGAPVLSGMAALRSGVDTLRIAVPETIRDIVAGYAKDFIVLKVKGDKITSKGFTRFKDLTMNRHDVVTVGMGLSNHPECVKFVLELFEHVKGKLKIVLDADAIRAFKGKLDLLKGSGVIITPHRAELRMMLQREIPEDPQELITFLEETALDLGIVILLKGQIDIITNGTRTILNSTGHPGMTVGGTGDVLAGIVGAVNCFIDDSFFATAIATYIMGKSGELAAEKYGNSLLASDVIEEISRVILELERTEFMSYTSTN